MTEPVQIKIFDTTLRDGEQSPGATMTLEEKLRIAKKLEELGVDVIEAGFPAASPGELESVRQVASVIVNAEVAALCRTREKDIDAAWAALKDAKHPRIHTFIATSDLHLEYKLKMSRAQVLDEVRRAVKYAKSMCANVEYSAEDATRSDITFLMEVVAAVIESGATVVNLPDTVGYTTPDEYKKIIGEAVRIAKGRAIISAHCHDDLGLAVANSIAAVQAGARQVEGCINGIGERAGNAALEEVIMALRTRRDVLGADTKINTKLLATVSRMVSDATDIFVTRNKAIVGKNAFAHEAGIHQHGMLQNRDTYEIMRPEDVGVAETSLVLGKHSGRHALQDRLKVLGYQLSKEQVDKVFEEFKKLSDRKKVIYDEDLQVLVNEGGIGASNQAYELKAVEFSGSMLQKPKVKVAMRVEGREINAEAEGDGPVHAAFNAIRKCVGLEGLSMDEFVIGAITDGPDAQGRVSLVLNDGGKTSHGHAAHTDIVVASALAIVNALNRRSMTQKSAA